ncbi:hypothetical protein GCM10010435_47510 [Winogradskya consettensis]|uniref:Uncharacterized protein n=1 Tax=Winogradskya consettensis TaxID=113560 RepID=A0A919SIY0_9ACTN|nr:hypothetical protein [Actinoplanes consettensis]GIM72886.1 hypothetical protein Aco04nite_32440 [Actinoplanes consettensis]
MSSDENTYVRNQNAGVDPLYTLGTITVASLREILADLPDDAVMVVAGSSSSPSSPSACSPLADVEECWYLPVDAEFLPLGRDADGNVHEPGPRDLYAVVLHPAG